MIRDRFNEIVIGLPTSWVEARVSVAVTAGADVAARELRAIGVSLDGAGRAELQITPADAPLAAAALGRLDGQGTGAAAEVELVEVRSTDQRALGAWLRTSAHAAGVLRRHPGAIALASPDGTFLPRHPAEVGLPTPGGYIGSFGPSPRADEATVARFERGDPVKSGLCFGGAQTVEEAWPDDRRAA